jgi:hypothetical protein
MAPSVLVKARLFDLLWHFFIIYSIKIDLSLV